MTYQYNYGGYTVKKKTVTEKSYDEEGRLYSETVTEETETVYPGNQPYIYAGSSTHNLDQKF